MVVEGNSDTKAKEERFVSTFLIGNRHIRGIPEREAWFLSRRRGFIQRRMSMMFMKPDLEG